MARGIVSLVLKLFSIMFLSVYSALQNRHFANIWYERMCFILCLGVLVMLCLSLFLVDSFDFGQNDMQFSWASIHSVQRKRHVIFKFKKNNMSSIWVSFPKKKKIRKQRQTTTFSFHFYTWSVKWVFGPMPFVLIIVVLYCCADNFYLI